MANVKFKNLPRFKLELDQFKGFTEKQLSQLLRKIAFQTLSGIVEKNPVDTGRSRANWQVSVNQQPGDQELDISGTDAGATLAAGIATLGNVPSFSVIYIYNNVEYIVYLEQGSSAQAPAGMVRVTIAEVESQFR